MACLGVMPSNGMTEAPWGAIGKPPQPEQEALPQHAQALGLQQHAGFAQHDLTTGLGGITGLQQPPMAGVMGLLAP